MTLPAESMAVRQFQKLFAQAKRVVVLTGAGVSAESGIPTFRGEGGLYRKYDATMLATPQAFVRDPRWGVQLTAARDPATRARRLG